MLQRLYYACRILGYLFSLGGMFYLLAHTQEPDKAARAFGIVGLGFLLFFVSYAMYFILRRRHKAERRRELAEKEGRLRGPDPDEPAA